MTNDMQLASANAHAAGLHPVGFATARQEQAAKAGAILAEAAKPVTALAVVSDAATTARSLEQIGDRIADLCAKEDAALRTAEERQAEYVAAYLSVVVIVDGACDKSVDRIVSERVRHRLVNRYNLTADAASKRMSRIRDAAKRCAAIGATTKADVLAVLRDTGLQTEADKAARKPKQQGSAGRTRRLEASVIDQAQNAWTALRDEVASLPVKDAGQRNRLDLLLKTMESAMRAVWDATAGEVASE